VFVFKILSQNRGSHLYGIAFNAVCIWKIFFIIGLEGQHQQAGQIFQFGEKAEGKGLSYKL
jgi:hypothetical protein